MCHFEDAAQDFNLRNLHSCLKRQAILLETMYVVYAAAHTKVKCYNPSQLLSVTRINGILTVQTAQLCSIFPDNLYS